MSLYLAQTGHAKGLSAAELRALLGENCIVDDVEEGFVIETELQNPIRFLNRCGGMVRLAEVVLSGPAQMPLNFEEWVVKTLREVFGNDTSGKLRFGLSMHPKNEHTLKKILTGAKAKLKSELGNVRYVNKDFQNLSSVQAWHEHLLDPKACELVLFKSETKWYLGKTVALQDFEAYSIRDYERPMRDAENGMFPPKLAQILINLATEGQMLENENPLTVTDPFCGSGTVLQEAWLMGYHAEGSDLDPKLVEASQKNLAWFKDHFASSMRIELEDATPVVKRADATLLKKSDWPESPFVIVTETYLGPALEKIAQGAALQKIQTELEDLMEAFLSNTVSTLPRACTMVFTAAYHRDGNTRNFLPRLHTILKKYGEVVALSEHERPTLFFERKGQLVSREIWKIRLSPRA